MWIDWVNGGFKIIGGLMTWLNVLVLIKHKRIAGVHIQTVIFFTVWGAWNLFYYPQLGQTVSFIGSVSVFAANLT